MSWDMVRLGDVCDIINGSTPKTENESYWGGDIIWVTPTDLGRLTDKVIFDSGRHITSAGYNSANTNMIPLNSIVLSTRAPIGHIAINSVELCTNQGCKGIVPNDSIHVGFLYFYLLFSKDVLEALGSGATFKELSTTALRTFAIPLPPLGEQQRIAIEIERLFAVVEKAKQAAVEQLATAQALNAAYLREVFEGNDRDILSIEEICSHITDGAHHTPSYRPHGVPFLSVKDITKGKISFDECRYISQEEHLLLTKRCKPEIGNILYTKVGTTGIAKEIDITDDFCIFVSIALLKLKEDVLPKFVEYSLNSEFTKKQADNLTQGAANRNLVIKDLKKITLKCPSYNEQFRIVEYLNLHNHKTQKTIAAIQAQLDTINAMPAAILRQAFSGQM